MERTVLVFNLAYNPNRVSIFDDKETVYIEGPLSILFDGIELCNFKANSGGYGVGPLDRGIYLMDSITALEDTESNLAYKKDGHPWWAPLKSLFNTIRTSLGMHPDGKVKGTEGCLGIMDDDINLFEILKMILEFQKELFLTVY